jgi:chromosome segregation ATPase
MEDLAQQIGKLTVELRLLRKETERNGAALELMLSEERLSKVESKLDDMNALKNQLEAREQEVQRRTKNIQQELILRGGQFLRRDQAEAAIRSEFQRALDDTLAQKETTQQRITDLQTQAEALRRRIEALRKKIEMLEAKTEGQNQ